ncbi:MAG TPA: PDZ domain-containing protein [Candidatus Nanoarchaeia archaeon]|nr:PDZ domain-containing protein [Candidatus Nanoarchaeia archaeon]
MIQKNQPAAKSRFNPNIFGVIVIALIFGMGGGAAAVIFARPYLLPVANNSLITASTNGANDSLKQANSIIENAKKIIAGQENTINDTISSGQNSIIGVFKKNPAAATSASQAANKTFDIAAYYQLNDAVGEGIVVTSDGWILASDFSKNSPDSAILKNFVAITKTNDIYNIDRVVQTGIDSYLFIHLAKARDLPVKNFISKMDLTNSQSLVALDWQGESYLTSIVDKTVSDLPVKDSDNSVQNIVFANNLGDYFDNAFIFSLDGGVVGYFDKKNGPVPLYNFEPLIEGLLRGQPSKRASLGITYVNLQEFAIRDVSYSKGALIYSNTKAPAVKPGGAADLAGLQAGDIIISVDNTAVDAAHDLGNILEKYSAGDSINVIFRRDGSENAAVVKLQ